MTLNDKVINGAVKYLEMTGREVIDIYNKDFIAYFDDDEVAIGKVFFTTSSIKEETDNYITRKEFEYVCEQVLIDNIDDLYDVSIRPDMIEVFVIRNDRAIIKHTRACDIIS